MAKKLSLPSKRVFSTSGLPGLHFWVAGVARLQCLNEKPNSGEFRHASLIGNSNHFEKQENTFCVNGLIKHVIAALTDVKLFQCRVTVQKVTGRLDDPSVKH